MIIDFGRKDLVWVAENTYRLTPTALGKALRMMRALEGSNFNEEFWRRTLDTDYHRCRCNRFYRGDEKDCGVCTLKVQEYKD